MIKIHNELSKQIIKKIKDNPECKITFYEYMKMALYEKKLGYYMKDNSKIGKKADFYTSSSVGDVFARTLMKNFLELFIYVTDEKEYNFLEIGGGNGRFANDALNELKAKNKKIYDNFKYYMLEVSPFHKNLQYEKLLNHLDKVIWINNISELPKHFKGIIFSNELIDSFPVHKVQQCSEELLEIYVTWDDINEMFLEVSGEISDSRIAEYFEKQKIQLKDKQIAEVNLDVFKWLDSINNVLEKGYILTIDYGYLAEVLYDDNRLAGTLMCYFNHKASVNPFQNIGEQDITSHVNFSALIDYSKSLGFINAYFNFQSNFLLNNGILDFFTEFYLLSMETKGVINDCDLKTNRSIRQLIAPNEMGETFKVLLIQKNIENSKYSFMKNIWDK